MATERNPALPAPPEAPSSRDLPLLSEADSEPPFRKGRDLLKRAEAAEMLPKPTPRPDAARRSSSA